MKKLIKVSLLIIIFGVPVVWYLFLQLFGTNQFELQVLETDFLPSQCHEGVVMLLYSEERETSADKNQFNRIKQYAQAKGISFKPIAGCIDQPAFDLFLVDQKNQLRGQYSYEILEVDRAEVEIDLLQKINEEDGSGD